VPVELNFHGMARTVRVAAVFVIASSVAQANHCSSGGECPRDDMPQNSVSLLQTTLQKNARQDGGENAAGQGWDPEVHKYMQHLKSLERRRSSSLLAERVDVVDASRGRAIGTETLFIVLSDSNHYSKNLRWISDSWGKDLSSSQLLAIGDVANEQPTRMRVKPTRCPVHTLSGVCCKVAEAVITAHELLEKEPNMKWAYIVEDDSYVRPEAINKQLRQMDPVGTASRGTLIAAGHCSLPSCDGVCSSGGIALSREALKTMVGDSPAKYLSKHMQSCHPCLMRGDMSLGVQARAHNISVELPQSGFGFHEWKLPDYAFHSTLTQAAEPLMYHPIKKEGQFKFLDRLFAKQHKSVEDGAHCATYNGNTICTSDLDDVPWAF